MAFQFLHEDNFKFICHGLTYDQNDYKVLDDTLIAFDAKTRLASLIVSHNRTKGFGIPFPYEGNQIQFRFDKFLHPKKGLLSTLTIGADAKSPGMTPILFLNIIPLSCKSSKEWRDHYALFVRVFHRLKITTWLIYMYLILIMIRNSFIMGLQKRGWMKRFNEHLREAMKGNNTKRFASLLGRSIMNAGDKLYAVSPSDFNDESKITGMHHVLIPVGRSLEEPTQIEGYLISKYSLQNPVGLNMLRGFKIE